MDIRQRLAALERRLPAPPRLNPIRELSDDELLARGHEVAGRFRALIAEGGIEATPDELALIARLEGAG